MPTRPSSRTRTSIDGRHHVGDRRADRRRHAPAPRPDDGLDLHPVPRMRRAVEFLCLLPLAIPAIVHRRRHRADLSLDGPEPGGRSNAADARAHRHHPRPAVRHRAIDAGLRSIDVATLAEAARSLGASWPRMMVQGSSPEPPGRILSAAVISVALVLGEYTISSLLEYDTLQVVIYLLGKRDAFIAVAVSLAASCSRSCSSSRSTSLGRPGSARPAEPSRRWRHDPSGCRRPWAAGPASRCSSWSSTAATGRCTRSTG